MLLFVFVGAQFLSPLPIEGIGMSHRGAREKFE
jgi:hypothetical protein